MDSYSNEGLIVSSGYHVIRETSTHWHALLLINQQRILLHFDVFLKSLFVSEQIWESFIALGKFVLEEFDALSDLADLLEQLLVRGVITSLDLRSPSPLLQSCLRHPQRRVLGGDVTLESLKIPFLFSNLLKFEQKIYQLLWSQPGLSLDRTSRLFVKEAKYDGGLDVAGRDDYAGKSSPHGHAFLLINK